ncbi:LTA synthase family protein [Campylobacter sp. MG1]|uniref:LTA synthase family protein n=1 Tax=Campylobacter sp. MG1 TaxID=2976332 RepID=UPI00226C837D|nr:sulfatase-like hydrolase/transferase [Campylobacter sp. MG1]
MNLIVRSFVAYLIFFLICLLFRVGFLLFHYDYNFNDFITSIIQGSRFDMQYCGYIASAYCIFSIFGKFVSKIIFNIACILILFAELTFIVFFNIYRKNIDLNLFLFKNEETLPLIKTAFSENYGIIPAIFIFFIALFVLNYIHEKILKKNLKINFKYSLALFIVFAFSMMLSINQKFSFKAASLFNVTKAYDNAALQASTFGHLKGFGGTIKDYYQQKNINFEYFNVGTPKDAICKYFQINPCKEEINIYDYIKHKKDENLQIKPSKVYYIITESLSDWIMNEKFNDLFEDIHNFKNKNAYISAINNADSTAKSLQTQLLGIYNNLDDNFLKYNSLIIPKTSLISQFKELGFNVDFYFGGARNWAGLFDFTNKLQINKNYDKEHIFKENFENLNYPNQNYWGAYDDFLFAYASKNSKEFSFNIIMTTTNHPTYDLAFMQKNDFAIPFDKIEKLSTKYKNELATIYWYQKTLINWIEKTAQNEPDSLFVITGDHYGRFNIDDSNDLFITHSVPVIMYYPKAKIYPTCKITNHLDISASIINLIAPKGYEYFSFGSPCFSLEKKEILAANKYGFEVEFKDGKITSGGGYLRMAQALSWYLVYKGNIIK